MQSKLIYGPPGTGKSHTLLGMMSDLVDGGISTSKIAFLSFTKSAATELVSRLGVKYQCHVSTIHSMCFRAGGYSRSQVVDDAGVRAFCQAVGINHNSFDGYSPSGSAILALRSRAINRCVTPEEEYAHSQEIGSLGLYLSIIKSYERWCTAKGLIDFDTMLTNYVINPVDHGWTHIFIDEGQDLSNLQWRVIDAMLSFPQVEQVIVAGDDDQSINEFAGASPHGMDDFGNQYNSAPIILTQSWRIPSSVHEVAERIIGRVSRRVPKAYMPRPEVGTIRRRAEFSPADIKGDTLILCRSNSVKVKIFEQLNKSLVPYTCDGKNPGPYNSSLGGAVRRLRRFQAGEPLAERDIAQMSSKMWPAAKALVVAGKWKELCELPVDSVFEIPEHLVMLYRKADMITPPTVRISTIHASKGREADNVILCAGMTERIANAAMFKAGSDAEHRVWYVGVTRAKHSLTIISDAQTEDYRID